MHGSMVAQRMESIPFAGIRRVFDKAFKLEAEGRRIIHFEAGRPDFDTPPHIKSAAMKALEDGMVHYTATEGIPVLREAMAESIRRYKKISYDPETEIIMTAGGQEAMYLGLKATINPGDEVLVPNPGFGLFFSSIRLVGGMPVSLPLKAESGFVPDFEQAKRLVSDKTRAIIVNSPHNPSGTVWSMKQIEAVCEFVKKFDLFLFSDETYDRMIFEGEFICPAGLPGMKDRTVILGSLSKTYAMTGWRIGYMAAPKEITEAAIRIQQNLLICLCAFAQAGATTALKGPQDCVIEMVSEFNERRHIILNGIEQSPGLSCPFTPRGAFYVFVKHHVPGMNSRGVTDYLLEEGGVAMVPGAEFGTEGEGFFRISYACSIDDCREGMDRIAETMTKLLGR